MAEPFVPRPPDYNVSALNKKTDMKGVIGAAWKNQDGTIRIKLNPFLVIDTSRHDLVVTLFPANKRDQNVYKRKQEAVEPASETPSEAPAPY